jgi:hypothetical protein
MCAAQISTCKVRRVENRAPQVRAREIGAMEIEGFKIHVLQIGAA